MPSPAEESEGLDRPNAPGLAGLERTVHSSAIFHECSYEFVEAIMLQIRKILLHPGKVLVKEEDAAPRSMYFVLFGTLDIYRLDQKIGSLTSGGVLGEGVLLGILDSWSYTVVARDSCMLAEMTSGVLGEVLQEHPEEVEYFEALLVTSEKCPSDRPQGVLCHSKGGIGGERRSPAPVAAPHAVPSAGERGISSSH